MNRADRRQQERELAKMASIAKDLQAGKPRICLTFAHPGFVQTDFMSSVLQVCYTNKYDIQIVEGYSGPLISKARNNLATHFLVATDAEYLLMADTDIVFNDEVLDRLLKADLPIVSALYVAPYPHPGELNPVALVLGESGKYEPLQLDDTDGYDPEQPIPVDGVGMGLCLIQRRVIEDVGVDIDKNWPFAEQVLESVGQHCGEDLTFCLRAQERGHQAYVIPAARAGHRKMFTI
jgi:hypothetical protein